MTELDYVAIAVEQYPKPVSLDPKDVVAFRIKRSFDLLDLKKFNVYGVDYLDRNILCYASDLTFEQSERALNQAYIEFELTNQETYEVLNENLA